MAAPAEELLAPRLERAIGAIYRPETELQSRYFNAPCRVLIRPIARGSFAS